MVHCVGQIGNNCEPPFTVSTFDPTSEYLLWRDPGYVNADYLWAGTDGRNGLGAVTLYRVRSASTVSSPIFDFPRHIGAMTVTNARGYTAWLTYPGGKTTFNILTHHFGPG